jgi:hypothetical protein
MAHYNIAVRVVYNRVSNNHSMAVAHHNTHHIAVFGIAVADNHHSLDDIVAVRDDSHLHIRRLVVHSIVVLVVLVVHFDSDIRLYALVRLDIPCLVVAVVASKKNSFGVAMVAVVFQCVMALAIRPSNRDVVHCPNPNIFRDNLLHEI